MKRYNLQNLIPQLLEAVPEIAPQYRELLAESSHHALSEQDIKDLREIEQLHQLPETDFYTPDMFFVVEYLLVSYIVDSATKGENTKRIKEIMDWVEGLAKSDIFDISNLVAVSICEPLITNYVRHIRHIFPYMGEKTKSLCTMQFSEYHIHDETKKLFGVE